MGIGLLAVMLFFLWLTWAFFSQTFTEYDDVKLTSSKSGLALSKRADVKLRGMIVGVVREIHVENGQVVMTLGMDPKVIDRVPAGVRAEIVPKTLFGEKYVDLIPTSGGVGGHLQAGDTISDATVPVEFEEFFNDIYPILTAVPPEKVGYTLTALANTLEGRGDSLGQTLEDTNTYLQKLNPETQQAVDDIVDLGKVSDSYAKQMDNFGELLRNTAEISDTVVDKRKDLADFFDETDELSDVLADFLDAAGDDIVATVKNSKQPLKISAEYSSMFPCWFKGLDTFLREHMDSILRNGTLHIDLKLVSPQATLYDVNTEKPTIPKQSAIDAVDLANPKIHGYNGVYPAGLGTICDELNAAAAGNPVRSHDNPILIPGELWKLVGVKNSHNGKLGTDADYNRSGLGTSNLDGIDSPAQREVLDRMTTALTGVKPGSVPDIASLMLSPVIRGAGVTAP
jgi:phospholipid/cholesterol/gamma-HCH transport system substrate-binding protein